MGARPSSCRRWVVSPSFRSGYWARARAVEGLATLDESQLRMLNPHTYPVGLDYGLNEQRRALVASLRDLV